MSNTNPIQTTKRIRRELYLYAFATQSEVINYINNQCLLEDRERIESILKYWEKSQIRVSELISNEKNWPDSIKYKSIPEEYNEHIKSIISDVNFRKTFSKHPCTIELVEIDKLIAPQRNVDIHYCNQLKNKLSKGIVFENLLDLCLSSNRDTEDIQHLEAAQGTHIFSSPNSDFRYLGSFLKKIEADDLQYSGGGIPLAAIISFIGYGGMPINVLNLGNRSILHNGFHRLYTLRSIGFTHAPVVVQHVSNIQLELPSKLLGLPIEYLASANRPVLMKDYFEPEFTIELRLQDRIKLVQISVSGNGYEAPV